MCLLLSDTFIAIIPVNWYQISKAGPGQCHMLCSWYSAAESRRGHSSIQAALHVDACCALTRTLFAENCPGDTAPLLLSAHTDSAHPVTCCPKSAAI